MSEEMESALLPLGEPRTAVEACASLIWHAIQGRQEIRPEALRYWLDLYHQTRLRAEGMLPRPAPRRTPEDGPRLRAEGCAPAAARQPHDEERGDEAAALSDERHWQPIDPARKRDWRLRKRETRERLDAARRDGVTIAQILEAAEGRVNHDELLSVLESKFMPIEVYRAIAEALDRLTPYTP